MTMLREDVRPAHVEEHAPRYGFEWIAGVLGALAAGIGTWMLYAPDNGVLTFFAWDFEVADVHEAWPMGLLIGGGVAILAAFGSLARKLYRRDGFMSGSVWTSIVLAAAGLALAVTYTVILIV